MGRRFVFPVFQLKAKDGRTVHMDMRNIQRVRYIIRALNHGLRHDIIALLLERGDLSVQELYIRLREPQSIVSMHLAILRKVDVVKRIVVKTQGVKYSLNQGRLAEIDAVMCGALKIKQRTEQHGGGVTDYMSGKSG